MYKASKDLKVNKDTPHGKVYRWVLHYAKPYTSWIILAVLCGVVATGGELMVPKLVQWTIDDVVPNQNKEQFNLILGGLLILLLVIIVAKAVRTILQRTVAEKAASDMQLSMFVHLRRLGFSYYESHPVGETLSLLNTEVSAVQSMYRRYLPNLLESSIFVLISVVIMSTISVRLSLVMVPSFLLYYIAGPYIDRKNSIYTKRMTLGRIDFNKKLYETFSGLREFRAYGQENWDIRRGMEKQRALTKTVTTMMFFSYLRFSYRRFTFYIGTIGIILYGYVLIKQGGISVGAFAAFLLMYYTTMFRITGVIMLITEQKLLMEQAAALYRFFHEQPQVEESDVPVVLPDLRGEIIFEDVHFGYPTRPEVLKGLSLKVSPGERVALVGTSGNGKSTLLKLISRFYDPSQGTIQLDGVSLKELKLEQIRGSIGYVFQETYLFGSTVRDNIMFGNPEASEEEMVQAAKAAYAHDFIMELPDGYDTVVGERGIKLSGGQKQRISIARMIIKNPAIVLLDEATSALDNVSEREVQRALDSLLHGRTTIAVAHRLSTVLDYDRLVFIHDGAVVEEGSYEELMARKGFFYRMVLGEKSEERGEQNGEIREMGMELRTAR
jgi:ATP-binding cassette, subfamily B, bacterial